MYGYVGGVGCGCLPNALPMLPCNSNAPMHGTVIPMPFQCSHAFPMLPCTELFQCCHVIPMLQCAEPAHEKQVLETFGTYLESIEVLFWQSGPIRNCDSNALPMFPCSSNAPMYGALPMLPCNSNAPMHGTVIPMPFQCSHAVPMLQCTQPAHEKQVLDTFGTYLESIEVPFWQSGPIWKIEILSAQNPF